MLCWIDLETTGLDPNLDVILEVGIILTDDNLKEIGRNSWLLGVPEACENVDTVVKEMHKASGLLDELTKANEERGVRWEPETQLEIIKWFEVEHNMTPDDENKPYLAGATVSFDRSFLQTWMPKVLDYLHYRNVDVTTVKRLAEMWTPDIRERQNRFAPERKIHRAIPDLEDSIAQLQFYKDHLFELSL